MYFLAAGQTDRGLCRSRNEDRICIESDLALFAVADGVGGHAGGAAASGLGVDALREALRSGSSVPPADAGGRLAEAVRAANRVVCAAARKEEALRGMGSTMTAALLHGDRLALAFVGDSRAYLLRDGGIRPLSEDHTLAAEQVRLGLVSAEEAEGSGMGRLVTRALGLEEVEVGTAEISLRGRDRLLLCTDGLTSQLPDEVILAVVNTAGAPPAVCRQLVEVANRSGGRDNVSVVMIEFFASACHFRWRHFLGRFRR